MDVQTVAYIQHKETGKPAELVTRADMDAALSSQDKAHADFTASMATVLGDRDRQIAELRAEVARLREGGPPVKVPEWADGDGVDRKCTGWNLCREEFFKLNPWLAAAPKPGDV